MSSNVVGAVIAVAIFAGVMLLSIWMDKDLTDAERRERRRYCDDSTFGYSACL